MLGGLTIFRISLILVALFSCVFCVFCIKVLLCVCARENEKEIKFDVFKMCVLDVHTVVHMSVVMLSIIVFNTHCNYHGVHIYVQCIEFCQKCFIEPAVNVYEVICMLSNMFAK